MTTATPGSGGNLHGLPSWHELLNAFRGWDAASGHPVAQCACGLAQLHRKRWPRSRCELVAERRAALINAIDTWAAAHVHRSTREPGTGSFGAHIDRMAAAAAAATRTLRTSDPRGETVHAAWTALAALADGWADITIVAACPYNRAIQD
ncbi:DUF4254 domain-containing protein [Nocardia sp. NBC_01730]|uniref:DUF4254 domain-containing protein n=1 Tax=Nocardia sp. NBC_01730 TaxID=2975998 RepID=UPI002E10875D|nr:DUF4254 domain-containing protein [Nocardia sp. NBC_01730]